MTLHDQMNCEVPNMLEFKISRGLSKLNFNKFKPNFRDTINPMCPTKDGIEDAEHFLFALPSPCCTTPISSRWRFSLLFITTIYLDIQISRIMF